MANIRISSLPTAQTITGAELVPVVQNGQTVQTTVSAITQSPALTQTFLTVGLQSGLPNSRYFSTGTGIGITDGGAQGAYTITLNGTSGSLETAGTGVIVKSAANTITARSLVTSGNGISVTNGTGVSGNPTFALTGLALALANATGTGILALGSSSTISPVTITGTSNQIGVTGGDGSSTPTISLASNPVIPGTAGVTLPNGTTGQRGATTGQIRYNTTTSRFEGYYAGSWQTFGIGDGTITSVSGTTGQINVSTVGGISTVSIATDPVIPGTGAIQLPSGTTAARPASPVNGDLRYNTTTGTFEGYANGVWGAIVSGSGVTSIGTGTGLTGGPITSTGTISIANTGVTATNYGSASSIGTFTVNAQGQLTAASNTSIAISASQVTSGTFTVSQGGTGVSTLTGLAYGNGTSAFTAATGAQVVSTIGSTAVTNATNATNIAGGASSSIPYQTGASTTSFIAAGTNGYILTMVSGAPAWATPAASVTSFQTSLSGLTPSTSTTGAVTLAGTLGATSGGTSQSTYATGDLLYASASNTLSRLAASSNGYVLTLAGGVPTWAASTGGVTSFSAGTTGFTPSTGTTGAITLAGTLNVANGGTGLTSLTAGYIPYGNGTGSLSSYSGLTYNATNNTLATPTLSITSTTSVTPALTFNAANTNVASGASVAGSYLQSLFQNSSNTAGASVNYVLSNNLGTDSSYYGEFGMNSSSFSASTPADFYSINNGVYFSGHDGDISVGSGNGYKTYLTYGTAGQSAHVINAAGAIGLSTNLGTTPATTGTTGYGTSGQVLTSGGSSAPPTWTTIGSGTSSYSRTSATATAAQTTFTVSYSAPYIAVYLNGVLLNAADYTATNGTTVVLTTAANAGDILDFIAYNTTTIATPAGSNTQVQYNSSGVLGASSSFTFTGNDLNIPFGTSGSATSSAKIALALAMIA